MQHQNRVYLLLQNYDAESPNSSPNSYFNFIFLKKIGHQITSRWNIPGNQIHR